MGKAIDPQTLVVMEVISEEVAATQRRAAMEAGEDFISFMIRNQVVDRLDLHRAWAYEQDVEFYDLETYTIPENVLDLIPAQVVRELLVVPIKLDDSGRLVVASEEPDDIASVTRLKGAVPQLQIVHAYASKRAIEKQIAAHYSATAEAEGRAVDAAAEERRERRYSTTAAGVSTDLGLLVGNAGSDVPKIVDLLIQQGVDEKASDIHIDPAERKAIVRYRVDGVARDAAEWPIDITDQITARIKVLASLDIAERQKPQDGRISTSHRGQKFDIRVAVLPAIYGEKITMRILNSDATKLSLQTLGFAEHNLTTFRRSFTKPYGMILVTGPTGSGKSTTLQATLNQIMRREINIITVEDPVEYRVSGITQIQVDEAVGRTFPAVLRSVLRSDPDVVLIGEIRDAETAKIAIDAALTGHLVLSTLHTNDAPSAITRLIEMGVEPYLAGSAVDCVLAQRLCRILCVECKVPYAPGEEELYPFRHIITDDQRDLKLFRAVGCARCKETGFSGRMAIHEVMPITEEIERLAAAHAPTGDVSRVAKEEGMRTLLEDGWSRIVAGTTSIEEVLRNVAAA